MKDPQEKNVGPTKRWGPHKKLTIKVDPIVDKAKQEKHMAKTCQDTDMILMSVKRMEAHIMHYCSKLYGEDNQCVENDLVSMVIPDLITLEEKEMLTSMSTMEKMEKEQSKSRFVILTSEVKEHPISLTSLIFFFEYLACTPIFNLQVVIVGLDASNRVFVGINVDFPSIHSTTRSMSSSSSWPTCPSTPRPPSAPLPSLLPLTTIAASSSRNFTTPPPPRRPNPHHLDPNPRFTLFSHFFARHFGTHHLLRYIEPFFLKPHHNALALNLTDNPDPSLLALAALEAVNRSHTPYGACLPNMVVLDSNRGVTSSQWLITRA
ncbi:hypothetical protein Fmac_032408 [Flemingia macrophylla]|uniref:Uncharacterized protein n=1 Tax=Flemingia macrophylla TaxID=520843 RepID=A0ABD1L4S9_9FABA